MTNKLLNYLREEFGTENFLIVSEIAGTGLVSISNDIDILRKGEEKAMDVLGPIPVIYTELLTGESVASPNPFNTTKALAYMACDYVSNESNNGEEFFSEKNVSRKIAKTYLSKYTN